MAGPSLHLRVVAALYPEASIAEYLTRRHGPGVWEAETLLRPCPLVHAHLEVIADAGILEALPRSTSAPRVADISLCHSHAAKPFSRHRRLESNMFVLSSFRAYHCTSYLSLWSSHPCLSIMAGDHMRPLLTWNLSLPHSVPELSGPATEYNSAWSAHSRLDMKMAVGIPRSFMRGTIKSPSTSLLCIVICLHWCAYLYSEPSVPPNLRFEFYKSETPIWYMLALGFPAWHPSGGSVSTSCLASAVRSAERRGSILHTCRNKGYRPSEDPLESDS